MPSNALMSWKTVRRHALDEIAHAHARVGGTLRGRRYATQQINQAYGVLLASHFQGFCRDLHNEAVDYLVTAVPLANFQTALRDVMVLGRKLDSGNAQPSSIGSDFARFGLVFWDEVRAQGLRNKTRQSHLEDMNRWRNAIAHQDFDPAKLGGDNLHLGRVRGWRRACEGLADSFDEVMRTHIESITGISPW